MPLRVKISGRAAAQVRQASLWWAENRPSVPDALAADFGEAVALVAEQPGIGARYEGARMIGVRRVYLVRVKYFIYYRTDGDELHVLAFWHARRERQPRI